MAAVRTQSLAMAAGNWSRCSRRTIGVGWPLPYGSAVHHCCFDDRHTSRRKFLVAFRPRPEHAVTLSQVLYPSSTRNTPNAPETQDTPINPTQPRLQALGWCIRPSASFVVHLLGSRLSDSCVYYLPSELSFSWETGRKGRARQRNQFRVLPLTLEGKHGHWR